jgi:hypothetical protein
MLHVSTFGTRIFQVNIPLTDFMGQWRTANTNMPGYGLMDFDSENGRVLIPCAAISSVVED